MFASVLQTIGIALALQGAQGLQIPAPTGYVNDFANVLNAGDRAALEALVGDVRAKSSTDIAVVTLRDLGQRGPEEIALRIGREWKVGGMAPIGERTRNAGVVILVVPKETNSSGRGECRVETGQGAEGFITDFQAAELCRAAIPSFRALDYSGGIRTVTVGVAQSFAKEFGFALDSSLEPAAVRGQPYPRSSSRRSSSGFPFFLVVIIVIVLMNLGGRRRRGGRGGCGGPGCLPVFIPMGGGHHRGGGWGGGGWGGGGGGGFGGFGGGGGFSGGGGGSSW